MFNVISCSVHTSSVYADKVISRLDKGYIFNYTVSKKLSISDIINTDLKVPSFSYHKLWYCLG